MSFAELFGLLFRWLHILAAITAAGGTIFTRFVVLPAHATLAPADRNELQSEMRRRWSKIVMASIAFLLLSGFYNYILIVHNYREVLPKWYHMLFGIKFLLAMAVFAIASLLAGRTALADRLGQRPLLAEPEYPAGGADRVHLRHPADRASGRPAPVRGRRFGRQDSGRRLVAPPPRSPLPAPTCASPLSPWTRKPRRKSKSCEIA